MEQIIPHSVVSSDRINVLIKCLNLTKDLNGSMSEVGVYRGGSAYHINKHSHGKMVFLFDTFEGIPMQGELDPHPVGDFGDTSYEDVKNLFKNDLNVQVIKGVFPDSAKDVIFEGDKFCFVHIDADQYESTKNCLEFFYPKMVKGGIILMDDYGWLKGVDKAIDEFFEDKTEKIIQEAQYQCYIIKL